MPKSRASSLDYMMSRRCSPQWRALLSALSIELADRMNEDQLHKIMFSAGQRMADSFALTAAATTAGLERAFNDIWEQIDWGYVKLSEEPHYLSLVHHCAPLVSAFGPESSEWSVAALEGAYARWFDVIGAGQELVLRQVSESDEGDFAVEFRLGQLQVVGPSVSLAIP